MGAAAVHKWSPPSGNVPEITFVDTATTIAARLDVLAFDDTTDEYIDLLCRAPDDYAGGGWTFEWEMGRASGTAAANIRIGVAIRRLNTAEDRDASHTYDFNEATVAMPTSVGPTTLASVTFTDGVDADSLAAGEQFIMRIRREPSDTTNDTLTGDAYGWMFPLFKET